MICLTSISPSGIERQQRAIQSWISKGYKPVSLNCFEEIQKLQTKFPNVEFIQVDQTGLAIYGKPYVYLTDFIKYAKHEDCIIINSDIIIHRPIPEAKPGELVMLNRYDFTQPNFKNNRLFQSGYDAFFITTDVAKLLPQTNLVMGRCHWDYWLPICASRKGIKLITYNGKYLFHEKHPIQYDLIGWKQSALIMAKELSLAGTPEQVSSNAFRLIRQKLQHR